MHANHLLLTEPIRMASILEPSRANFFPTMTKIVGTLGPRSRSIVKAGMSGGVAVGTTGRDFTPHVVKIKVGEGCFELLTLTGSPALNEVGGVRRTNRHLIIASFKQIIKKQLLKRHFVESSSANGMPGGDLDTTPMSTINAIAVEAYKKYILVSLINLGQVGFIFLLNHSISYLCLVE
ncbi:Pyruvate kinase 2, cytosolic [Camellia lanceoleosa]|uniref:Pyruvate kinase 2, cytosolic n=1 Tax=Camellia lanceoleosa TaxID=1840588 RepID=A0ACC0HC51_9ERIC|nr:Pyruvate kinase 2, cytosolic [Camellia lanceoleosa]